MMSWAQWCDLGYAIVGMLVVYAVSLRTDAATGILLGGLMILCYLAGSVKYRAH